MSPLKKVTGIIRHLGPRWLAFRVWHAGRVRSGVLVRRDPVRLWNWRTDDGGFQAAAPRVLAGTGAFEKLAARFAGWDTKSVESPLVEANELLDGRFRFYSWRVLELGLCPAWQKNALTGESLPAGQHWSKVSDFGYGDIKNIWEPSRWSWAFVLARAFTRTKDVRYAARFRELTSNWMEANPPGVGPNWKCGQEAALRLIAACGATAIFASAGEADAKWLMQLATLAEATARRIDANLDYALSQDNNHGLSELAGLLTVAVLFPKLNGSAQRLQRARAMLIRELNRLVAADGCFAQYSTNYHRMLLHHAAWCGRLLAAVNEPLPQETMARLDAAAVWTWQLMDLETGSTPCYGSNDGANVLKLEGGSYADHRAAVQALFVLTRGAPVLPLGPWDETAAWLFGPDALIGEMGAPERKDFVAPSAGYHVLRRAGTEVFVRCGPHRFRPHHADQLHVDLRRDGRALTLDPGTFSYNVAPPWDHAFKNTRFHNTVSVDGRDQMEKAGRFLWLPWSGGTSGATRELAGGAVNCWEGETSAWLCLKVPVWHRRAVLLHQNGDVTVIDRLQSPGAHDYRLHWQLPDAKRDEMDGDFDAILTGADGMASCVAAAVSGVHAKADWVRADEKTGRGWASPRYTERVPSWSWEVQGTGRNMLFATHFGRVPDSVVFRKSDLLQVAGMEVAVGWDGMLVREVRATISNS